MPEPIVKPGEGNNTKEPGTVGGDNPPPGKEPGTVGFEHPTLIVNENGEKVALTPSTSIIITKGGTIDIMVYKTKGKTSTRVTDGNNPPPKEPGTVGGDNPPPTKEPGTVGGDNPPPGKEPGTVGETHPTTAQLGNGEKIALTQVASIIITSDGIVDIMVYKAGENVPDIPSDTNSAISKKATETGVK